MKDLYTILGVPREASQADVKKAYRTLAKELHPDRHKGDEKVAERFKEVSAAYAILGDKDKRGRYDRGEIDESGAERGPFAGAGAGYGGAHPGQGFGAQGFEFTGTAEDLFADLFGFSTRRGRASAGPQRPRQGQSVSYELTVGFLDAAKGASKRVTLPGGRTLDVQIPAGVKDGQQIRLAGQGNPGSFGGPDGDALIKVHVAAHPHFTRDGDDILLDLPITIDEAVLGARITVPTIEGSVSLTVPKGSSSGRRLRLRGKGIGRGGHSGDQYVTLKIVLPDTPDADLESAIRDWAADHGYSVRDKLGD